jgi:hypothetical protein
MFSRDRSVTLPDVLGKQHVRRVQAEKGAKFFAPAAAKDHRHSMGMPRGILDRRRAVPSHSTLSISCQLTLCLPQGGEGRRCLAQGSLLRVDGNRSSAALGNGSSSSTGCFGERSPCKFAHRRVEGSPQVFAVSSPRGRYVKA